MPNDAIFRGDAHASADSIGIGGWQCDRGPMDAAWFSVELDRFNASWAYAAGESFRRIASLELFTTLLCVMLLPLGSGNAGKQRLLTGETDNRGNSFAVGRWSTTKAQLSMMYGNSEESTTKSKALKRELVIKALSRKAKEALIGASGS